MNSLPFHGQFSWEDVGSLTNLFHPDDEIVLLPQRPKQNRKSSSFYGDENHSSTKSKKPIRKKLNKAFKSDSTLISSSCPDRVDNGGKGMRGKNIAAPYISHYSTTNQFSSDPITNSGCVAIQPLCRTRSWSEASESDSSVSPVRQALLNLGLQHPTDSSWETDDDCETPRKLARSSSQSSVHSDSSADLHTTRSVMPNSDCASLSMTNPIMIAAARYDSDVPVNYPYYNHLDQSPSPSVPSHGFPASFRPMYPNPRYDPPTKAAGMNNDVDYSIMWNNDEEFLFPSASQDIDIEKNDHTGCPLLVGAVAHAACSHSNEMIVQESDFNSARTSRDEPLSDCDSEMKVFGKYENHCSSDEVGDDDVDLLTELGSLMSFSLIDPDEDPLSLSISHVHNSSVLGRVSDTMGAEEGDEFDDLLLITQTTCNAAGILEHEPKNSLPTKKEDAISHPTVPVGANHLPPVRSISSSDVQRLARAALLGEVIEPMPASRMLIAGFPIPSPIVTMNTANQYLSSGSSGKSPNNVNALLAAVAAGVSPASMQRQQLRQRQQMKHFALTQTHLSPRHYLMHASPRNKRQAQLDARSPTKLTSRMGVQKKTGERSSSNGVNVEEYETKEPQSREVADDDDTSVFALLHTE